MQLSERSYPILSRVCIGVGILFLVLSAFGNWRFGWSLSSNLVDQWWLAIIYGGSDVAAGVMVATGATMLRHPGWRWKVGGVVALIPALILVALSVLSTFGMMSGRIAVHAGQKAALVIDEGRLKWIRSQTINWELPKSERRAFMKEEREAAKKTREAASVVTDNQAVAIVNAATLIGAKLTVEQTQVGLTFVSSTMPMMIKFVCLGIGFFLFGARTTNTAEPAAVQPSEPKKTEPSSSGSGGKTGGEPKKPQLVHSAEPVPTTARTMEATPPKVSTVGSRVSTDGPQGKLTFEQFRDTIRHDMAHGEPASSTRALAAVTGWSQSSVVRVQKKVKGKHNSPPRRFAGNGGGLHFGH